MSTANDGGPAFPNPLAAWNDQGESRVAPWSEGMALRDFFATRSDQPGINEAYQFAGCPGHVMPPGQEKYPVPEGMVNVHQWWNSLPLTEKYRIYAGLRFMVADAMLAARGATP